MALVVNDRVQQTGTANTTVSFTLSGSVVGYQSFAVIGNGNTTFYAATDVSGNWEVGIGTYATSGPTLTRTTILSSSNSGSAVTFSGTVNVFVTYPSEQSVNLDASGNVTALGTITSGVWNGSTLPVAYGGTGVTASSGANSVVLRDANQNISFNNFIAGATVTTAAAGTTILTVASTRNQILVGSTTQTIQLPNATTLQLGQSFIFVNNSSGILTITNNAGATLDIVPSGGTAQLGATSIATSAGSWGIYSFLPGSYNFNNVTADFGGASIIDAVWNGTTIGTAYGGTGLTTFTGSNNALYSTGASTLTAGTLPVAAGGTGNTTLTSNGVVYGNGTSAAGITAAGTTGQVLVATTSGAPSWGSVPAGSITGVVPIVNGGTGQTTAAAAFNALSPLTTTGDIIYEASASTAARLGIGSTGQVLTVAGGIPSWATPSTGGGTITRTDFTATSGQTVFAVNYDVGLIDVYQNGAKLAQADFTATNGTSFTLATGATTGDLIQAEVFSSLNIYSTITAETFNGTGSQTIFTMSAVPANSASLLVAISGVVQDPTTYTVSSNTLTFSTAPPSGTGNVAVRYLGVQSVSTVSSFSAGTTGFTPASATSGGVVLAGTLATTNGGTGLTAVGTNGQVLTSNGTTLSYQTPVSTPGGSNTQVQYNSGGAFAGSANFVFDGTNVGIGTTSPAEKLHVYGGAIRISNTSNSLLELNTNAGNRFGYLFGTSSSVQLAAESTASNVLSFSTAGSERMRIDSSGNVGIGTTTPNPLSGVLTPYLTVQGASYDGVFQALGSRADGAGAGVGQYNFLQNANTTYKTIAQVTSETEGTTANNRGGRLMFFTKADAATSTTERMRITSTGVMYLGALGTNFSFANASAVDLSGSGTGIAGTGTNLTLGVWNGPMVFQAGNSGGALVERMRIDSSGNVGIGVTPPAYSGYTTLALNSATNGGLLDIQLGGTRVGSFQAGSSTELRMYAAASVASTFYAGGSERMRITSAGDVGIGTTSPAKNLVVKGTTGIAAERSSDTDRMIVTYTDINNYANASGANNYNTWTFTQSNNSGSDVRMQISGAGVLSFNSGYGSAAAAYGTRAWVNFNGTGTVAIRASGNVSSITDNGTGDYTMNFSTAMPDANYVLSGTCMYSSGTNAHYIGLGDVNGAGGTLPTTTAVRFRTIHSTGAAAQDCTWVEVSVIR